MNVDVPNQTLYFSIKQLPNCPHETWRIPFQIKSTINIVEVPGIEPATSQLVIRHAEPQANEAVEE